MFHLTVALIDIEGVLVVGQGQWRAWIVSGVGERRSFPAVLVPARRSAGGQTGISIRLYADESLITSQACGVQAYQLCLLMGVALARQPHRKAGVQP